MPSLFSLRTAARPWILAAGVLCALTQASLADNRHGGSVAFNVGAEPPTLISATNTGAAMYVTAKVVEGLLTYDTDFAPLPQLATEWSVSDDGLIYHFKLREGVKWHDGQDFDAEDVAFSILALKEEHPRGRGTFANITDVQILGSHEVNVVYSSPAPYFLRALAAMEAPILPEHIFAGQPLATNPALNAPVGTGPFRFAEWVRGSHVLLERNDDYWDRGKPFLDQVVIRFISDPAGAVAALETDEVQVTLGTVPYADIERLRANPALAFEPRGTRYNNSILRALINLDRPELQDQRVRQAIAHAIDKDFIVQTIYLGHARRLDSPVSPDVAEFHAADLPTHAFDLARAEALLDEAGLPRQADGIRFALHIDPMQASGPHRQIADYLAQSLAAVGIRASVRTQDFPGFVKRVYTDRDFDIAIEPMSNLFDPTVGVQRLYWSKNFRVGVPFSNGANYRNPQVDALLEQAASENDPAQRRAHFIRFQQIVAEELPAIDLVVPDAFAIYRADLRNLSDLTLDGVSGNWADVYVDR